MGVFRWWRRTMTPAGFDEQVAEVQQRLGFSFERKGTLPEVEPPLELLSIGDNPSVGYVMAGRRGHARVQAFSFSCGVTRDNLQDPPPITHSDSSGIELLAYLAPGHTGQVVVSRTGALMDLQEPRPGRVQVVAAELHSRRPYPNQPHVVTGDDVYAVDDCDQGRLALFLEPRRGHSFEVAGGHALCLAPVVGPARVEDVLVALEQFVSLLP